MFKETINGLDKILHTDILKCSMILVTGSAGTMKSGLVFNLMSNYLSTEGCSGHYMTLEQTKESHLMNMDRLDLKKGKSLHIFDFKNIRAKWKRMSLIL